MNTDEIRDMIRKPLQDGECSLATMIASLVIVMKDLTALRNVLEKEATAVREKANLHQYLPDDRFTAKL